MDTSDELSGILTFLNQCFSKYKYIKQITDINDIDYLDKVLVEIEENFFSDMSYLPSDSESNIQYNLRIIYHRISNFYEYSIKKPLESKYFDYESNTPENFLKLSQLIVGICVQSKNRDKYFEILNELEDEESNEIISFLNILIPVEQEEEKETNNSKNKDIEENTEEKKIKQVEDEDKE